MYTDHYHQKEIEHQMFMAKLREGERPQIVRSKRIFVHDRGWINVEIAKPH